MNATDYRLVGAVITVLATAAAPDAVAAEWGLDVSRVQFDSGFSRRSGIEEDAWAVGARLGFNIKTYFSLGVGARLLFLHDDNRFSQDVLPVDGPNVPHTAQSSETAGSGYLYGKLKYRFAEYVSGNALFGYEHINFDREIDNCIDCPSENINVDAGFFVGAGLSFGRSIQYSLAYQAYPGGSDVKDQIIISIGKAF